MWDRHIGEAALLDILESRAIEHYGYAATYEAMRPTELAGNRCQNPLA